MYKLCVLILFIFLTACNDRALLAPVVELKWQPNRPYQTTHIVRRGETLYAIAFRYDQDYRQLADNNHLHKPYALRVGQLIRVNPGLRRTQQRRFIKNRPKQVIKSYRQKKQAYYSPAMNNWSSIVHRSNWVWPIKGRVATGFNPQQGKKGIDIAGRKGEGVRAATSGVVAYAGSGLSGYGNLIIIKHDNQFLTAYGNNARNIVKEGQRIKAGQIIAEIGIIDRHFLGVHFEIRKAGKPVNPLSYLSKIK